MRAYVNACDVRSPSSLEEALEWMASEPGRWQPIAGGTDLMVGFAAGEWQGRQFIDISRLRELSRITVEDDAIILGALVTYTDVLRHRTVGSVFPLLPAAAAVTGGAAIQNRGTLGGNIMNASPAADTPPVLLVYEAELELTSIHGSRWLPYRDFHTAYRRTRLAPGELLTRIRLPRSEGFTRWQFRKVGARKAQAISKVCFAAVCGPEGTGIRIAYGSVAPVPVRCLATEAAVREGKNPSRSLVAELAPIDDARSTAAYRLRVAQNLLTAFLQDAQ